MAASCLEELRSKGWHGTGARTWGDGGEDLGGRGPGEGTRGEVGMSGGARRGQERRLGASCRSSGALEQR